MAAGFAKFQLVGRAVQDAELKQFGETTICNFTVAVNDGWKNKDHVSYYDCTLFGNTATALYQYITKGKSLSLEGDLRQDRWEKDESKRSKVTFQPAKVVFGADPHMQEQPAKTKEPQIDDDDIPF